MVNYKSNMVKLVQENTQLHNELKNVTIHEILNDFQNQKTSVKTDLKKKTLLNNNFFLFRKVIVNWRKN